MQTPKQVKQLDQPELFDPPRNRPSWTAFPPTVRVELTKLFEAMLRGATDRVDDARVVRRDGEHGDE